MSAPRYPGYDVMRKRSGPSWNEPSRRVIDERIAVAPEPRFFDSEQWRVLSAVCARILPQPANRPPVPLAALVDGKVFAGQGDGYRDARLPPLQRAWRIGLDALDAEAVGRYQLPFALLADHQQDSLLVAMQRGQLEDSAWAGMPAAVFFAERLVHDITSAYYAHPTAWNEIGFGGPASPRGYVRLDSNRRDAWEPAEARLQQPQQALELNRRVR